MPDLYNILLKNTENILFGANPMSIIAPRKGEVVVKTKKLLVTYNGEEQEPIDCQSVTIKYEADTIILDIVLPLKDEEQKTTTAETVPQAEAIIPASETDTFILQGDDLEAFEMLSDFRREENQAQKTEKDGLNVYIIESGTFDIQDLTSIENAMLDIVAQERQFIDKGYKAFKTNTPKFDYENSNNFKLVESVVLIKQTTDIVEESK